MRKRALIVPLAIVSGGLMAQDSQHVLPKKPTLEEIVVTAQRREQSLQEVPAAVAAYNEEFIVANRVTTVEKLADYTPGFNVEAQSVDAPSYNVRGITSDDSFITGEASVSVFFDGMDISRRQGAWVELFDIARVEVVKGPQGALFGTGSANGAINIVTQRPHGETAFQLKAEHGSYDSKRYTGFANLPLTDRLSARLAATTFENEGYIDNAFDGSTLMGQEMDAARLSLRYELDTIVLDLIANIQKDRSEGVQFSSLTIDRSDGRVDFYGSSEQDFSQRTGGEPGLVERNIKALTLLAEWQLGQWTLNSTTGIRAYDNMQNADNDGSRHAIIFSDLWDDHEQVMQELRAEFVSDTGFSLLLGGAVMQEDLDQTIGLIVNEQAVFGPLVLGQPYQTAPDGSLLLLPLNPGNLIPLQEAQSEETRLNAKRTVSSLFVDAVQPLTDKLELQAGLRYVYDDKEVTVNNPAAETQSGFALIVAAANQEPPQRNFLFPETEGPRTGEADFSSWQPRLVLRYLPTDDLTLWGGVARGTRAGIIQYNRDKDLSFPFDVLDPEIVTNFEVGAKAHLFDRRVYLEMSAFYYEYKDFQTTKSPEAGNPESIAQASNAGQAHAQGIEVFANAAVTDWLKVFFAAGMQEAEFDEFIDGDVDLAGNQPRMTPETTATLGFSTEHEIASSLRLTSNLNYSYRSRVFFENFNEDEPEGTGNEYFEDYAQDAYGLLDASVSLASLGGRWEVSLWGENLLDKEYFIDMFNSGGIFLTPTVVAGVGRTAGVGVTLTY